MKRWWWAVALGTLAIGFMAGMLAGPGNWMGRGGYAKPLQPGYGPGHGYMMNYMHDSANWDDMAGIMGSPENRQAMVEIMSSPEMRRAMVDMMQQPEMRRAMAEVMSDPGARKAFVDMMAIPQMSGVFEDMAGDTRVRRYMETALQKSLR